MLTIILPQLFFISLFIPLNLAYGRPKYEGDSFTPLTRDDGALIVEGTLKIYGNDSYPITNRKPLPLDAPRARYPGFQQSTKTLKAGAIRRDGARELSSDIVFDRDVPVTLRDGTVIYTDILRPVNVSKAPAIISWSPYGKEIGGSWLDDAANRSGIPLSAVSELQKFEASDPAYWVAQGYVILNPDTRGAYSSKGNITYWGRQLAEDGYDYVEWAAAQSWCSGKVAFAGNSWLAASQWFIAAEQPPHLAAIAPWEGFSDLYREIDLRGGIPQTGFSEAILTTFAGTEFAEDQPRMIESEQLITPYWTDKIAQLEKITVPAYIVASYTNAIHTYGTFEGFRRISSESKWLRVHNSSEWNDFYEPESVQELTRFFDRFLKGNNNDWDLTPQIRVSVLDPGHEDIVNQTESTWPPSGTEPKTLYLQANSSLSSTLSKVAASASYAVNSTGLKFTYTVPQDMDILGYMKVRLWVEAIGSDDMDLTIAVAKLDANGNLYPQQNGSASSSVLSTTNNLRVSRRNLDKQRSTLYEPHQTFDRDEPLRGGEIVAVDVGLWPTGTRFHKGETLGLTITPAIIVPSSFDMGFGTAIIPVPADGGTYIPGHEVAKIELGGPIESNPAYVNEQRTTTPESPNKGAHVIHFGGKYESQLLMPVRLLKQAQ
ncbi:hypothetical protein E8E14_013947 [Neopestalotiopsis sp. 37M]|nr:hypothetical protein E8E14_013947 [Neopestalotiopsis sp. 37M]